MTNAPCQGEEEAWAIKALARTVCAETIRATISALKVDGNLAGAYYVAPRLDLVLNLAMRESVSDKRDRKVLFGVGGCDQLGVVALGGVQDDLDLHKRDPTPSASLNPPSLGAGGIDPRASLAPRLEHLPGEIGIAAQLPDGPHQGERIADDQLAAERSFSVLAQEGDMVGDIGVRDERAEQLHSERIQR